MDAWERIPKDVVGRGDLAGVKQKAALRDALWAVATELAGLPEDAHEAGGVKRRLASAVVASALRRGEKGADELLTGAGLKKDDQSWRHHDAQKTKNAAGDAPSRAFGSEAPAAGASIQTESHTIALGSCVHVGRRGVVFHATRTPAKAHAAANKRSASVPPPASTRAAVVVPDAEEVAVKLYFEPAAGAACLPRLLQVACVGGAPAAVCTFDRGTPLAEMPEVTSQKTAHALITGLLEGFAALETSGWWNLRLDPSSVLVAPDRGKVSVRFLRCDGLQKIDPGYLRDVVRGSPRQRKLPSPGGSPAKKTLLGSPGGAGAPGTSPQASAARSPSGGGGAAFRWEAQANPAFCCLHHAGSICAAASPAMTAFFSAAAAAGPERAADALLLWQGARDAAGVDSDADALDASGKSSVSLNGSHNRITKRIARAQEAGSEYDDEDRRESMRELALLKQRRKSARSEAKEQAAAQAASAEWLRKQAEAEAQRQKAFLEEIERKEEVAKLRAALRGAKKKPSAADGPLADAPPLNETWLEQQRAEETRRRAAFLKEIDASAKPASPTTLSPVKTKKAPPPAAVAASEAADRRADVAALQEKLKSLRRHSYAPEIVNAEDGGLEDVLVSETWRAREKSVEEQRRAAFLREIDEKEKKGAQKTEK